MSKNLSRKIRRAILEQSKRANVGHVGSALCVADIFAVLFSDVLRIPTSSSPERDRFVLSKGHAALALYAAMNGVGRISAEELNSFCGNDSLLGVHPEHGLPGVDFATGSLGQGFSFAAGAALAAKLQSSNRRSFALLSDAECNEGAVWESAMFAAHHKLSNLVAIVDLNGQQALGYTEDILSMSPMSSRWKSFGWMTYEVDGNSTDELLKTFRNIDFSGDAPHAVIARTTFGSGVSFMENQIKWHYLPMSDEEFVKALAEVDNQP